MLTLQPLPGDPLELELIEANAKLAKLQKELRKTEKSFSSSRAKETESEMDVVTLSENDTAQLLQEKVDNLVYSKSFYDNIENATLCTLLSTR